jgi:hypothetical protein
MRFKDDPRAETFFQPRKGAGQISQQADTFGGPRFNLIQEKQ